MLSVSFAIPISVSGGKSSIIWRLKKLYLVLRVKHYQLNKQTITPPSPSKWEFPQRRRKGSSSSPQMKTFAVCKGVTGTSSCSHCLEEIHRSTLITYVQREGWCAKVKQPNEHSVECLKGGMGSCLRYSLLPRLNIMNNLYICVCVSSSSSIMYWV